MKNLHSSFTIKLEPEVLKMIVDGFKRIELRLDRLESKVYGLEGTDIKLAEPK